MIQMPEYKIFYTKNADIRYLGTFVCRNADQMRQAVIRESFWSKYDRVDVIVGKKTIGIITKESPDQYGRRFKWVSDRTSARYIIRIDGSIVR